jgi:hypothetical protein
VLSLPLGEGETDFLTVGFVFFVDVFYESLEVFSGFISHGGILIACSGLIIAYFQA